MGLMTKEQLALLRETMKKVIKENLVFQDEEPEYIKEAEIEFEGLEQFIEKNPVTIEDFKTYYDYFGLSLKQSYLDFPDGKWNCIKAEIEKYSETDCLYKLWYYPGEGDIYLEFIVKYTVNNDDFMISGVKKFIDDEWYTPTETPVSISDAILEFHKWYLSHLEGSMYTPEHIKACASLHEGLKDRYPDVYKCWDGKPDTVNNLVDKTINYEGEWVRVSEASIYYSPKEDRLDAILRLVEYKPEIQTVNVIYID